MKCNSSSVYFSLFAIAQMPLLRFYNNTQYENALINAITSVMGGWRERKLLVGPKFKGYSILQAQLPALESPQLPESSFAAEEQNTHH